jgi:hypothetical protein
MEAQEREAIENLDILTAWDKLKAIEALAALARDHSVAEPIRAEARQLILVVADAGVTSRAPGSNIEYIGPSELLRRFACAAEKGVDDPRFEEMRSRVVFERNGRVLRECPPSNGPRLVEKDEPK